MPNEHPSEYLVDAILRELGLSHPSDAMQVDREWLQFNRLPQFDAVSQRICVAVAYHALGRILQKRLNSRADISGADHQLLNAFQAWGFGNTNGLSELRKSILRELKLLTDTVRAGDVAPNSNAAPVLVSKVPVCDPPRVAIESPSQEVVPSRLPETDAVPEPKNATEFVDLVVVSPPNPIPVPDQVLVPNSVPMPIPIPVALPISVPVPVPPITSQWQYLALPDNEPDPHTEFDAQCGRSPEEFEILGARVRGKKHKHDGTHCDDWFSFRAVGGWTILAVSDGGGAYRFSRVGAKAACEAVTEFLSETLSKHVLQQREIWDASSFEEADVGYVKESLVSGVIAAWEAVKRAVEQREADPAYENILGRPLTTKDLYCTLLVTVHTTVRYQDSDRSLIFGLAVGDGMMAAVDQSGHSRLLMTPDSGEHSGEVRFLDQREVDPDKLRAKIFPVLCNLRALLLMTDGVADDYFPNDPGMTWVYGDLVLNEILPVPCDTDGDVTGALAGEVIDSVPELSADDCVAEFELPNLDQTTRKVRVRSISKLAEKFGLPAEDVVRQIPLLKAGRGESSTQLTAQERLQQWLDSYHVRGSFDDRTLLVMHR